MLSHPPHSPHFVVQTLSLGRCSSPARVTQQTEAEAGVEVWSHYAILAPTTCPLMCTCLYSSLPMNTYTPVLARVFITHRSHVTSMHPNTATNALCGHSPRHTGVWVYLAHAHTHSYTHGNQIVYIICSTTNFGKFLKRQEYQSTYLPPKTPVCRSRNNS